MGNYIISEDGIMNLTFFNFILILFKEIGDFFYSFFAKRIKQFSLLPGAKDYNVNNIYYNELKEKKENISFDLYIEDILEFDPNFKTIFQILQKNNNFIAKRRNFIMFIKKSPYYCLSILKFLLRAIILIIYFYYTIKDNIYVCSYKLALIIL